MSNINKNPFINAVLAAGYIVGIVFVMGNIVDRPQVTGTLLVPMVMISLFVLSAAVMGFLFVYEPMRLFWENQKPQAVSFFLKTLGTFACIVILFIVLLIYIR